MESLQTQNRLYAKYFVYECAPYSFYQTQKFLIKNHLQITIGTNN